MSHAHRRGTMIVRSHPYSIKLRYEADPDLVTVPPQPQLQPHVLPQAAAAAAADPVQQHIQMIYLASTS